ncbi:sulfotransferase [Mucilaginibacter sp. HMF5004]|uniref:sulfotransferase n=1 Tax=Mucilaginibacter rivuli TaxID=2857527 RepID=UPI001C603615|nr:sulfotransferase [Mucilaginibacter rivuli]MBW4889834.1 sulfotransferase [Mucilaginibacter rivuli]
MINPLQGWIPYKLTHTDTQPQCHWINTLNKPFTEPFFDETIMHCKSAFHKYFHSVSDLSLLEQWAEQQEEHVKPTAFIFHISRCGSTLASQLLGIDEQNISLAEVPFFDDLLRLPYKNSSYSAKHAEQLFITALKFYSQKRTGNESRLFIKTDSWHIFFYEQIRELYPDVPFILLYRSPDEVLYSHTKVRGMQAVPGIIEPQLFGFEPGEAFNPNLDEYTAKVLERYLTRYIEIAQKDKNVLLLNYNEGPMDMIQSIARFSKTIISNETFSEMQERSGYHSKRPGQVFAEEKTVNYPEFLSKAINLYKQVDTLRLSL